MPRSYVKFIDGNNLFSCKDCQSHLTGLTELISKAYRGRTGTAYLFNNVHNIKLGQAKDQNMLSGLHTVSPIFCSVCNNTKAIGWKYIKAYQASQKFKQGKFILEIHYIRKQSWEQDDDQSS